jgi:hypothetical protein
MIFHRGINIVNSAQRGHLPERWRYLQDELDTVAKSRHHAG